MQLKWPMLWDLFSLFPAYAGVIQVQSINWEALLSFPRIRGGDPRPHPAKGADGFFSPHTRG